jgi:Flp pilus assembly pilin Flp
VLGAALTSIDLKVHEGGPQARLGSLGVSMTELLRRLIAEEQGQDIAEYAVVLAVILVIVIGTIRLVGSNANNTFSSVASSVQ